MRLKKILIFPFTLTPAGNSLFHFHLVRTYFLLHQIYIFIVEEGVQFGTKRGKKLVMERKIITDEGCAFVSL